MHGMTSSLLPSVFHKVIYMHYAYPLGGFTFWDGDHAPGLAMCFLQVKDMLAVEAASTDNSQLEVGLGLFQPGMGHKRLWDFLFAYTCFICVLLHCWYCCACTPFSGKDGSWVREGWGPAVIPKQLPKAMDIVPLPYY